jgi:hypothetical protein
MPVEDLLAPDLALARGVVALPLRGAPELDAGDEKAAGFADRLEVAVHLDRSYAIPVAERASVHLGAQLAHLAAGLVVGEPVGLAVMRSTFSVSAKYSSATPLSANRP